MNEPVYAGALDVAGNGPVTGGKGAAAAELSAADSL